VRRGLSRWLFNKLIASGHVRVGGFDAGGGMGGSEPPRQQDTPASEGPVIEGEYQDIGDSESEDRGKPRTDAERARSPWRK